MKSRTFLIPSLLMAGFGAPVAAQENGGEATVVGEREERGKSAAVSLFRADRPIQLAGHSSHRSHSSHSSHRSSSGGGGYYTPAPVYTPPPSPPAPPPPRARPNSFFSTPSLAPLAEDGFVAIVRRVQAGLKAFGYYAGAIDGQVGAETRAALMKMQSDFTLKETGTITPEVLRALSID